MSTRVYIFVQTIKNCATCSVSNRERTTTVKKNFIYFIVQYNHYYNEIIDWWVSRYLVHFADSVITIVKISLKKKKLLKYIFQESAQKYFKWFKIKKKTLRVYQRVQLNSNSIQVFSKKMFLLNTYIAAIKNIQYEYY